MTAIGYIPCKTLKKGKRKHWSTVFVWCSGKPKLFACDATCAHFIHVHVHVIVLSDWFASWWTDRLLSRAADGCTGLSEDSRHFASPGSVMRDRGHHRGSIWHLGPWQSSRFIWLLCFTFQSFNVAPNTSSALLPNYLVDTRIQDK